MQKKVGIRLRHLETNESNKTTTNNQEKYTDVNRKRQRERERSTSPMSRRKIFGKSQIESIQQVKLVGQQYQSKPYGETLKQIKVVPNQNKPQILNSNIPTNDNYEYQSEVQRLIESLKKKTIEAEKKQQTIKKLNKQIQQLKFQNGRYMQEIRQLKLQLEGQRNSKQKINIAYIGEKQKYNSLKNENGLPNNKINTINTSWKSVNLYENQPYQQFAQEKSYPNNYSINENVHRKQQISKIKQVQYEHLKDSSKYEQFLSPLMVLNSQKPKLQTYSQSQRLQTFSNQEKASFRTSSGSNLYKQQQQRQNTNLNSLYPSQNGYQNDKKQKNENPFQRKIHVQQRTSPLRTLESTGKFDIGITQGKKQQKTWVSYETDLPYFRRRQQVSPIIKGRQQKEERCEKYLQIEDSKNFKFQDFEFDDFDPSTY